MIYPPSNIIKKLYLVLSPALRVWPTDNEPHCPIDNLVLGSARAADRSRRIKIFCAGDKVARRKDRIFFSLGWHSDAALHRAFAALNRNNDRGCQPRRLAEEHTQSTQNNTSGLSA